MIAITQAQFNFVEVAGALMLIILALGFVGFTLGFIINTFEKKNRHHIRTCAIAMAVFGFTFFPGMVAYFYLLGLEQANT